MRYYIATRTDRIPEHNALRDRLAASGCEITYDWTENFASSAIATTEMAKIAALETKGVLDADWVFVLLDGGRGTHVELGIAIATGKDIVIVESASNGLLGGYSELCPFYLCNGCTIVKNTAEAVEHMTRTIDARWRKHRLENQY